MVDQKALLDRQASLPGGLEFVEAGILILDSNRPGTTGWLATP
jgi:hypothetical protein